jgi:hypothetical protein
MWLIDALADPPRRPVPPPTLTHWSFDAGPTHIDSAGEDYTRALAELTSS